jgi:hypothetical protein
MVTSVEDTRLKPLNEGATVYSVGRYLQTIPEDALVAARTRLPDRQVATGFGV